jgi:hypothetical protein
MTGSKRIGCIVQERDRHLLRELGVMRVINREQAQIITEFPSVRRANRRLLALTRAGMLRRIFVPNTVFGEKAVYTLSSAGAALVDSRLPGLALRQSRFGASPFLLHRLEVNEIYLTVKYRRLPKPDMRLSRWISFREPLTQAIPLTPDGYFEIANEGASRAMFLEVDLGTESMPVWTKKTQLYLQMALSGSFTELFRQQQFRVLVIATTERRLQHIRSVIAKSTDKVFWISTFDDIKLHGFWSSIWRRPTGDQRLQLI